MGHVDPLETLQYTARATSRRQANLDKGYNNISRAGRSYCDSGREFILALGVSHGRFLAS